MGFLSYNLDYYRKKTEYYENTSPSKEDILEAKRLLKLVGDLARDGYFELESALQKNGNILDRLKAVIRGAGERPFETETADENSSFEKQNKELSAYLESLIPRAEEHVADTYDKFFPEIKRFCEYIGYYENTAYVFLLRDTLLPYFYFKGRFSKNLYPFIISRSFFNCVFKKGGVDDIIRSAVFKALEEGICDFESYFSFCKKEICKSLTPFPEIIAAVKGLLSEIECDGITVVETGVYATFPLLLSALDDRVDFKMYTTVPYLYEIYKDRIYTRAYENIRRFETLCCHNNLFQLTAFGGGKFYVSENVEKATVERALKEINAFLFTKEKT